MGWALEQEESQRLLFPASDERDAARKITAQPRKRLRQFFTRLQVNQPDETWQFDLTQIISRLMTLVRKVAPAVSSRHCSPE
jgi:hypothetical protein